MMCATPRNRGNFSPRKGGIRGPPQGLLLPDPATKILQFVRHNVLQPQVLRNCKTDFWPVIAPLSLFGSLRGLPHTFRHTALMRKTADLGGFIRRCFVSLEVRCLSFGPYIMGNPKTKPTTTASSHSYIGCRSKILILLTFSSPKREARVIQETNTKNAFPVPMSFRVNYLTSSCTSYRDGGHVIFMG